MKNSTEKINKNTQQTRKNKKEKKSGVNKSNKSKSGDKRGQNKNINQQGSPHKKRLRKGGK